MPANFVQDPVSLIWLPSNCLSMVHLLIKQKNTMQSCYDAMTDLVQRTQKDIAQLQDSIPQFFKEVRSISNILKKFCSQNHNNSVLSVQKRALFPWIRSAEGVRKVAPIMSQMHQKVLECVNAFLQSRTISKSESSVDSESDPPVSRRHTRSKNVPIFVPNYEPDSDEEFLHRERIEVKGKRPSGSRMVSSHAFQKMKVCKKDVIITSKKLHRRNSQIYINVTRLQEFIRNEGRKPETDPFIEYINTLDSSHFVDETEFNKVQQASEMMLNRKRSLPSAENARPRKQRTVPSAPPSKHAKTVKRSSSKEIISSPSPVLSPSYSYSTEDDILPNVWIYRTSQDSNYFNYPSLFPLPDALPAEDKETSGSPQSFDTSYTPQSPAFVLLITVIHL